MFRVPENLRLRTGPLASKKQDGNNGAFLWIVVPRLIWCIASDGLGWEHVSVHVATAGKDRTPTWDEMCEVKSLFWDPEDVVMQLHPRASRHVNCHPHTLHLWRPIGREIPEPDTLLVGPRESRPPRRAKR